MFYNLRSLICELFHFAEIRSLSLADWTAAYQWAVKNVKVLQAPNDKSDYITLFINSSTSPKDILPATISTYHKLNNNWQTFKEFKRVYFGTWKVIINKENLHPSTCSCPYFAKHLSCKHVIGMQIWLKLVDPPPASKCIPRGQKMK